MSSDNDRCFHVKKLAIWHATAPIYDASTAINTDTLPWIALIKYHHQAHQHCNTTNRHDRSSSRHHSHTRHSCQIIRIGPGLVVPHPTHIPMDIEIAAIMTPVVAASGHPTDLHDVVSHATEAQAHTTTTMTHDTTDLIP